MIKMTLQPLVENAIIHGFKHYTDHGLIRIYNTGEEGRVKLVVEDNGMGMTEEQLEQIRGCLDGARFEDASQSFGMKNVNDRIRHFFGDAYGLSIESEFGAFTKVFVSMPEIAAGQVSASEVIDGV